MIKQAPAQLIPCLYKAIAVASVIGLLSACAPEPSANNQHIHEKNNMSMLMKKPVFNVHLDMLGPGLYIFVNGVTFYQNGEDGIQLNTRFPVNHLMHPKDNTIAMRLFPKDEGGLPEGYRAKLTLTVHDFNAPEQEYTIAELDFRAETLKAKGLQATVKNSTQAGRYDSANEFKANPQGDVLVGDIQIDGTLEKDNAVLITLLITVPNSLPLWAFFNSDSLPDYSATHADGTFVISEKDYDDATNELLNEYMKVQKALESNNIQSILPVFEERNREIDAAFYRHSGTTLRGIKSALQKANENTDLKLAPLSFDNIAIEVEENLKMIGLYRQGRDTAIGYNDINGGSESFPIMFRKQNGKWILTR